MEPIRRLPQEHGEEDGDQPPRKGTRSFCGKTETKGRQVGMGHWGSHVETGAAGARAHDTTSAVPVTRAIGGQGDGKTRRSAALRNTASV